MIHYSRISFKNFSTDSTFI